MKIIVNEQLSGRYISYEKIYEHKASKYKGVQVKTNKKSPSYIPVIHYKNLILSMGYYKSEEIAAKVYDIFAITFLKEPQLNEDIYPDLKKLKLSEDVVNYINYKLEYNKRRLEDPYNFIPPKKPQKLNNRIIRIKPTKEELLDLFLKLSISEITTKFKLTHKMFKDLCKEYNLSIPPCAVRTGYKRGLINKTFIVEQIKSGKSPKDFKKEFNIDFYMLKVILKYYNILWEDYYPFSKKICPVCNSEFKDNLRGDKKFCSEKCSDLSWSRNFYKKQKIERLKKLPLLDKICNRCKRPFQTKNKLQKNCSDNCKIQFICSICKKPSESRNTCHHCREDRENKRKLERQRKINNNLSTCSICGNNFINKYRAQTCSLICKKLARKQWRAKPENKQRMRLASKLYNRLNRKTKSGNIKHELKKIKSKLMSKSKRKDIKLLQKRLDYFGHNICCYCNKYESIQNNQTIDHLLAIVNGGDNSFNNLYFACRKCNEDKWDKSWLNWFRSKGFYSLDREKEIIKLNSDEWKAIIENKLHS